MLSQDKKSLELDELLGHAFRSIAKGAETAYVIVTVTILEDLLEEALLANMRNLSKDIYARLFKGYGPLSSLYAKIDLAFALKIVDGDTANDFHTIRKIRNEFAHANRHVHFGKMELDSIFQKFRGWKSSADKKKFFEQKIADLTAILNRRVETAAVRKRAPR